ncbi:hypothetical protein TYRP_023764 [Tyrophagus putrescentiae]|nr:hypothetical protein TYRP_023764 [Tyrophagus putrescentiae]
MEIPVTTTTASSSSLGDQTVSDSPNSLTTQPPEMLTQIADCLPLTEQLRLRGQTRLSTDQNLSELVVCRAAVRRIVKQQQQEPPNPSNLPHDAHGPLQIITPPSALHHTPNSSLKSLKSLTLTWRSSGVAVRTYATPSVAYPSFPQWRTGAGRHRKLECCFPPQHARGFSFRSQRWCWLFHSKETDAVKPEYHPSSAYRPECRRQLNRPVGLLL